MLTNFSAIESVPARVSARASRPADDQRDASQRDTRFRERLSQSQAQTQAQVAAQKNAGARANAANDAREDQKPAETRADKQSSNSSPNTADAMDSSDTSSPRVENEPEESTQVTGEQNTPTTPFKTPEDVKKLGLDAAYTLVAPDLADASPDPQTAIGLGSILSPQVESGSDLESQSVLSINTELGGENDSALASGLTTLMAAAASTDKSDSDILATAGAKIGAGVSMTGVASATLGEFKPENGDRLAPVSAEGVAKDFASLLALAGSAKSAGGTAAAVNAALGEALEQSTGDAAVDEVIESFTQLQSSSPSATAQAASARPAVAAQAFAHSFGQQGWSNEVGEKVLWMAAQNLKSAEIRLDPPELGTLQVRVTLQQDQVQVNFVSAQAAVREALDAQASRLRDMIAEQGLNLIDVNVSDRQSRDQDSQHTADTKAGGEGDAGEELATGQTRMSSHLVDHYV